MNQDEIERMGAHLARNVAEATRENQPKVPVLMSVGDSRPYEVGHLSRAGALPELLHAVADEAARVQARLALPNPRADGAGPVCQYCLADARYTPIGGSDRPLCPVCGAAYSGPRRDAEYRQLAEAGLVAEGDYDGGVSS